MSVSAFWGNCFSYGVHATHLRQFDAEFCLADSSRLKRFPVAYYPSVKKLAILNVNAEYYSFLLPVLIAVSFAKCNVEIPKLLLDFLLSIEVLLDYGSVDDIDRNTIGRFSKHFLVQHTKMCSQENSLDR